MADLKDKIVLVTGAAGAIGGAVVAAVKHAGGVVITADLAERAGIDTALGVTSEADWKRVAKESGGQHGQLDGLVNAAGIVALGTVEQLDFATWKHVLAINLDGTFLGCQHAFPSAAAQAGWLHRQSFIGIRPDRGAQSRRLQRFEGGCLAADEIGGALWRVRQTAGALQRRVPGLRRRPDGRQTHAIGARPGSGAGANGPCHSARAPWQTARDHRALHLYSFGRVRLHHRCRLANRRRADGTIETQAPISAATCAATERDSPCRS